MTTLLAHDLADTATTAHRGVLGLGLAMTELRGIGKITRRRDLVKGCVVAFGLPEGRRLDRRRRAHRGSRLGVPHGEKVSDRRLLAARKIEGNGETEL